jgi:hypothetical protein
MPRRRLDGLLDGRLGWALFGLGAMALVLTMLAVLRPEAEQEACHARVWGGATAPAESSLLRVELAPRSGSSEEGCAHRPIEVRLSTFDGSVLTERRVTDEQATAVVEFDGRRGISKVEVRGGTEVLARGSVQVPLERFRTGAKSEGGVLASRRVGECGLEVGLLSGVAVMGLSVTIVVQVVSKDESGGRRPLELEADGLSFEGGAHRLALSTDPRGLALVQASVTDLSAELTVRVPSQGAPALEVRAAVPVRAGIRAALRDRVVVFTSPVERAFAYYALVGDAGWVSTGKVALGPAAGGLWEGTLAEPSGRPGAGLWMVGTEPSLQGQNVIGWDLSAMDEPPRPRPTRVLPLVLWLDGRTMVEARLHREHQRAVRQATLVASGLALLLVGTLGLLSWRSQRRLRRHFVAQSVPHPATLLGSGAAVGWLYAGLLAAAVALLWIWGLLRPGSSPPAEPGAAVPTVVVGSEAASRGVGGSAPPGTTAR